MLQKNDLYEILKKDNSIELNYKASDWRDAINRSGELLVKKDVINKKYIEHIISSTEKNGAYYVMIDSLAVPHSTNALEHVKRNGVSILTLDKEIKFERDERRVIAIITVAAVDGETLTSYLIPQIIAVFENSNNFKSILSAKDNNEVLEIIKNIDYKKYLN